MNRPVLYPHSKNTQMIPQKSLRRLSQQSDRTRITSYVCIGVLKISTFQWIVKYFGYLKSSSRNLDGNVRFFGKICAVPHIYLQRFLLLLLVKTNQKVELKATALISLIKVLCKPSTEATTTTIANWNLNYMLLWFDNFLQCNNLCPAISQWIVAELEKHNELSIVRWA